MFYLNMTSVYQGLYTPTQYKREIRNLPQRCRNVRSSVALLKETEQKRSQHTTRKHNKLMPSWYVLQVKRGKTLLKSVDKSASSVQWIMKMDCSESESPFAFNGSKRQRTTEQIEMNSHLKYIKRGRKSSNLSYGMEVPQLTQYFWQKSMENCNSRRLCQNSKI